LGRGTSGIRAMSRTGAHRGEGLDAGYTGRCGSIDARASNLLGVEDAGALQRHARSRSSLSRRTYSFLAVA
jgi:hypothetical protein